MVSRDSTMPKRQDGNPAPDQQMRRWETLRPRRPVTLWGWLVWLLIVLLLYLLVSYVVLPWWFRPLPTDIPPSPPVKIARVNL